MGGAIDGLSEKVGDYVNRVLTAAPVMEKLGYSAQQIALNVSLTPSVKFQFTKLPSGPVATPDQVLEEYKDDEIVRTMVRLLVSAEQCQQRIKLGKFQVQGLELTLGLSPTVTLNLEGTAEASRIALDQTPRP